jgi:hypothetical protein
MYKGESKGGSSTSKPAGGDAHPAAAREPQYTLLLQRLMPHDETSSLILVLGDVLLILLLWRGAV